MRDPCRHRSLVGASVSSRDSIWFEAVSLAKAPCLYGGARGLEHGSHEVPCPGLRGPGKQQLRVPPQRADRLLAPQPGHGDRGIPEPHRAGCSGATERRQGGWMRLEAGRGRMGAPGGWRTWGESPGRGPSVQGTSVEGWAQGTVSPQLTDTRERSWGEPCLGVWRPEAASQPPLGGSPASVTEARLGPVRWATSSGGPQEPHCGLR